MLILTQIILEQKTDFATYINPLIGSDSEFSFSHGNTLPFVAQPLPMVSITPDMTHINPWWIYVYNSCADPRTCKDPKTLPINGFRFTHMPSPWIADYGDITIMPLPNTYPKDLAPTRDRIAVKKYGEFSHNNEESRAYKYAVTFKNEIKSEYTATKRSGYFRFKYNNPNSFIAIDLNKGDNTFWWNEDEPNLIFASTSHNTDGIPKGFLTFYSIKIQESASLTIFNENGTLAPNCDNKICSVNGNHLMALYQLNDVDLANVLVGTSYISYDYAIQNLQHELNVTKIGQIWSVVDFKELVILNKEEWNLYLSRIEVAAINDDKTTQDEYLHTFYTAMYRILMFPHSWTECKIYNSRQDCNEKQSVHRSPFLPYTESSIKPGYMFVDEGTWDNFRTKYPFYALAFPDVSKILITSMLNAFDEGGWLPQWSSPGYRKSMTGTHSDCIFADAIIKNVQGLDKPKMLKAVLQDAFIDPKSSSQCNGGICGRSKIDHYNDIGYAPGLVSVTLDYAHDNFCAAQLAKLMNDTQNATKLLNLSQQFMTNIFKSDDQYVIHLNNNASINFQGTFRSRKEPGLGWNIHNKDLKRENDNASHCTKARDYCLNIWGGGFVEGAPWQYMFDAIYNVPDLSTMFSKADNKPAKVALNDRLDAFFSTTSNFYHYGHYWNEMFEMPHVGFGQFSFNDQPVWGNEHQYDFTDNAWKTQCIVRNMMNPHRGSIDDYSHKCFPKNNSNYPATLSSTIKMPTGTNYGRINGFYSIHPSYLFANRPDGLTGDEDNGSMSAWYLFSAIGLYPVPGTDLLLIGSPIFTNVTIRIPEQDGIGAKTLQITAVNNSLTNIFVKNVKVNGRIVDISQPTITQTELLSEVDNKLEFVMGSEPSELVSISSMKEIRLEVNQSILIMISGKYSDGRIRIVNDVITWSTDNKNVIIDANGTVTALVKGNSKITARVNQLEYEIKVTVQTSELNVGVVVGVSFGGIVLICIILIVVICIVRRKKQQYKQVKEATSNEINENEL